MTDNELHIVFGTGPVGLAVMDELVSKGKRVRMVNRSGRAHVAEGVEVVGGDAADPGFTRGRRRGGFGRLLRAQPSVRQVARTVPTAAGGSTGRRGERRGEARGG